MLLNDASHSQAQQDSGAQIFAQPVNLLHQDEPPRVEATFVQKRLAGFPLKGHPNNKHDDSDEELDLEKLLERSTDSVGDLTAAAAGASKAASAGAASQASQSYSKPRSGGLAAGSLAGDSMLSMGSAAGPAGFGESEAGNRYEYPTFFFFF